ncbi:MAG: FecR family protein [Elsteraceae bacterium]
MYLFLIAALPSTLGRTPALASDDEAIGRIKTSVGEAFLVNGAARRPAEVGALVRRSDVIETGRDGAVGLTLTDNSILSAGPNSQLSISNYKFNSAAFNGSMKARLNRGTLAVTSGDIARGSPEAMQVETPTAILGVRGTTFLVRAGQD